MAARLHLAAAAALALAFCLPAAAQDYAAQTPPVDPRAMGAIATVGAARIGADEVFELWTPIWIETLAKVRNGKMAVPEGDAKLDAEWRRVIMSLIKDEVLYQEAEHEHASMINSIVDAVQRQGATMPRAQILAEIRRRVQQDMERIYRRYNADALKEAGGAVKLHRVLQGRGLSFQDWQRRSWKKAFTQFYLSEILKNQVRGPGPRDVQTYYANNPDKFSLPGLIRFKHIFLSTASRGAEAAREAAVEAWERIEDGEIDFEAAVAQYSDDTESKNRGGLETGEEAADPEREAWLVDVRSALREETPGVVAPILESSFGFHVAVLVSVGQPRRTRFDEAQRDIIREVEAEEWEKATDNYYLKASKNTDIKVLFRRFPQHLSCAAQAGLDARAANVYQINKPNIERAAPGGRH